MYQLLRRNLIVADGKFNYKGDMCAVVIDPMVHVYATV